MTTKVDLTLLLSWDTCDLEEDSDGSFEWECLIEDLTRLMQQYGTTKWFVEASGLGWQSRSGHKRFEAETGDEFLRGFLPKTDCVFTIHSLPNGTKGFKVVNSHHDAMGELYFIYPVEEVVAKIVIPVDHAGLLATLEDSSSWTQESGIMPPRAFERRYDYPLQDGYSAAVVLTWSRLHGARYLRAEVRFFRPGDDESYAEFKLWPNECHSHRSWETEVDSEQLYVFNVHVEGSRFTPPRRVSMLSRPKTKRGLKARQRIVCAAIGSVPGKPGKLHRNRR